MANIKLSTIEERLKTMRRADNRWADVYVRDVSHLLKLVKANTATPSDEVKQRARAVKDLLGFLRVTPLKLNEEDAMTLSMLINAVTATDVEQGDPNSGEIKSNPEHLSR